MPPKATSSLRREALSTSSTMTPSRSGSVLRTLYHDPPDCSFSPMTPLIDRETPHPSDAIKTPSRALQNKTLPVEVHGNDATTIYTDNRVSESDKPHHPLHCPLGTSRGSEIPLPKQPNRARETSGLDVTHEHHDPSKSDPVDLAHHDPLHDEVSPTTPLTRDPSSLPEEIHVQ